MYLSYKFLGAASHVVVPVPCFERNCNPCYCVADYHFFTKAALLGNPKLLRCIFIRFFSLQLPKRGKRANKKTKGKGGVSPGTLCFLIVLASNSR